MDLQQALNWRYAVKKYSNRKITDVDLAKILDATNLSASSAGMQPYRLFVLNNEEYRSQLRESSFNPQIQDASHLIVFAALENITQETIDNYMSLISQERSTPIEQLADFKKTLETYFLSTPKEENFTWAARQAYIALGTALIAAAELEIDSTPMEGFDRDKLDKMLGLEKMGLKSVVLLALGYRDAEQDIFAKFKKVRIPKAEFVTVV